MKKIERSDLESTSLNFTNSIIEDLNTKYPDLIVEGPNGHSVNIEVLKLMIGDYSVSEADEKYGFNWSGKRLARKWALTPSAGTLRPVEIESVEWESTKNLIIEGDNLEVLKLLQKSYSGKVKVIYIDPPYNTGKDFVYADNYQNNIKNYLELTGQTEGGIKQTTNTDTSGRFHTDWLNMIYPRLKLARNLLSEDGLIAISIDDNEISRLSIVCDEIFGADNFIAKVIVQANKGGRDYLALAQTHEYMLIYAKSSENVGIYELAKDPLSLPLEDVLGRYEVRELRNRNPKFNRANRPNLYYPFYVNEKQADSNGYAAVSLTKDSEHTIEVFPRNSVGLDGCWRWGSPKAEGAVVKGNPNQSQVVAKQTKAGSWNIYEKNRKASSKAKTIWDETEVRTEAGTREVRELFGQSLFDHPKPLSLVKKLLSISTQPDGDHLVLDFFAGSGTTGEAVMSLNSGDGGNRRYILVQLPELLDPEDKNQAITSQYCDSIKKPRNIAEITKQRIRLAGTKINAESPLFPTDIGFRNFKLDTSNIKAWDPHTEDLTASLFESIDHIHEGRTSDDVLYEIAMKLGLELTISIQRKKFEAGKTKYELVAIGGGLIISCLSISIASSDIEQIALEISKFRSELQTVSETVCIFLDSAFESDVAKTNITAILEQNGIPNVRSI